MNYLSRLHVHQSTTVGLFLHLVASVLFQHCCNSTIRCFIPLHINLQYKIPILCTSYYANSRRTRAEIVWIYMPHRILCHSPKRFSCRWTEGDTIGGTCHISTNQNNLRSTWQKMGNRWRFQEYLPFEKEHREPHKCRQLWWACRKPFGSTSLWE